MPRPALLFALLALLVPACGGGETEAEEAPAPARNCAELADDAARDCYIESFTARVKAADDPVAEVEAITAESRVERGFLLGNCHGIMHTVARSYAAESDVTLASLMEHLPRSNDPGCPAGFAHGLVTAVAPELDLSDPRGSASVCGEAETRYQRYSCIHGFGHAFMRVNEDRLEPALALCRALGPRSAPDCAQGAYHDYWFAIAGFDDAVAPPDAVTDPRKLCGAQPEQFVRPCWYRAFVDNRPEAVIETTADLEALCRGLEELQRDACLTAASVIGPADPREQMLLCSGLPLRDALACVRGVKVQNLIDQPPELLLQVVMGCERFAPAAQRACYRWLGKTSAVLTDGLFEETGCPALATPAAVRACVDGARAMDEALVTFS